LDFYRDKIEGFQNQIRDIMKEERAEKEMIRPEEELRRANNIVEHRDEILARPKKTWFQSHNEK
jgi:ATP-dependent RNA helicase DDX27